MPDRDTIKHLFRRGVLAAGHRTYEVRTLPALPFAEFLGVVDELRPAEAIKQEVSMTYPESLA